MDATAKHKVLRLISMYYHLFQLAGWISF